ncbi:isoprenylcysteine carboxylmethyltransferase family protein [Dechloromonas sp. TW-R-39-2]|uniref:methyltransferase family protein n=1 Tax=Dechloromonas sp. TW-R-39-2 TaxID=2654218 RepID=UPI001EF11ECA|nr:isoprenylcysteine carboxylmethyltransferase family protein [Dechloromonas sp. TW-R-39-2]
MMRDLLTFLVGSAILLWLSRKAIVKPGRHGFYRFFAWEGILALLVLNHEPWGESPFSPHQIVSWLLMLGSILLVAHGYAVLKEEGKAGEQREDTALYDFEKTTKLVDCGIFAYIRHPMYASLLALAWGAFFQDPGWAGSAIASLTSFFLFLTAKADEQECLQFFGPDYADYMKRTRMFLPWLI